MRGQKGFSLTELMVVIATIAIMASLALPNYFGQAAGSRLRGAGDNLRGDLQFARARAVRNAVPVTLRFTAAGYTLFNDANSDGIVDPGETTIRSKQFPAGVQCNLVATDFPGAAATFTTRGQAVQSGTVVLNRTGEQLRMTVSLLGQITIQ